MMACAETSLLLLVVNNGSHQTPMQSSFTDMHVYIIYQLLPLWNSHLRHTFLQKLRFGKLRVDRILDNLYLKFDTNCIKNDSVPSENELLS